VTGLESLVQLKSLWLGRNKISSLDGLESLRCVWCVSAGGGGELRAGGGGELRAGGRGELRAGGAHQYDAL
jgi:hypothetical protein